MRRWARAIRCAALCAALCAAGGQELSAGTGGESAEELKILPGQWKRTVEPRLAAGRGRPPREHAAFSGPDLLAPLAGECLGAKDGTYEYSVCLFRNVTQRKWRQRRDATVLGVWGHWGGSHEAFQQQGRNAMVFVGGDDCNGKARNTTVHLACAGGRGGGAAPPVPAGEIASVGEVRERDCNYEVDVSVAISCSALAAGGITLDGVGGEVRTGEVKGHGAAASGGDGGAAQDAARVMAEVERIGARIRELQDERQRLVASLDGAGGA